MLTLQLLYSAWLAPKDISKLKSHEIDAYINEPTKKNGDLLAAYRVALKPEEWEAGRATMAVAEDEDAEADADADIDELASEPTDGKRKRKAPVKKTGKKAKKEAHDAESEDEGEPPAKKSKKSGKKDKEDDKKDEDAEGDADGEVTKDKKALEVRDWRHKLQKTFLSTKGVAVKDSVRVHCRLSAHSSSQCCNRLSFADVYHFLPSALAEAGSLIVTLSGHARHGYSIQDSRELRGNYD